MIFTNRMNLPDEIYEAIVKRQSRYHKGEADYSVTELIDSPRISILREIHQDQIEADVHDLIPAWLGHLVHDALEKKQTSARLFLTIDGVTISGAYDFFDNGVLKDYKTTSVWTVIYGSNLPKWEKQLNLYAFMIREHGQDVNSAFIEALMLDWSPSYARRDHSYPQSRHVTIEIPVWSRDDQEKYLRERLALYDLSCAYFSATQMLPECTPEDRWETPTTWAVFRNKNKRATKVFDNPDEAEEFASQEKGMYVVPRPGEWVRCERYCDVARWCDQYQRYKEERDGS